jgi:DUF3006 family protein
MPETHRFIIDRYEGDLAVVEVDGRGFVDLPRWLLPAGARADDVLAVTLEAGPERATITIARDAEATTRARDAARAAVERLKRRDPGGDVVL